MLTIHKLLPWVSILLIIMLFRGVITNTPLKTEEERIRKLKKKECELVIARYNEDISWSKPYAHLRTVYNKGKHD